MIGSLGTTSSRLCGCTSLFSDISEFRPGKVSWTYLNAIFVFGICNEESFDKNRLVICLVDCTVAIFQACLCTKINNFIEFIDGAMVEDSNRFHKKQVPPLLIHLLCLYASRLLDLLQWAAQVIMSRSELLGADRSSLYETRRYAANKPSHHTI